MPNNILITPGDASIQFSGSEANTIRLQVESAGDVVFYSGSRTILGITNNGAFITGSFTGSFVGNGTGLTGVTATATPSAGTISSSAQVTASIVGATIAPSILSASIITASNVQLLNLTSTTNANSVLVLETGTNRIFTTASVGGGSGTGFPFTGTASITGSLIVSSSGINVIGNGITGSLTSGAITNISGLSMAVSGTIPATGTTSIELNLNTANYFSVSGSGTGTVTWTVINPPANNRAQTFVIEYTNGGIKTNSWFTNTRWPAGVAPSLTSASANLDMLSFTTDDAGSNWRGVLLQRGSA